MHLENRSSSSRKMKDFSRIKMFFCFTTKINVLLKKCKEVMVFKADEHEFDGKEITSYHLTSAHLPSWSPPRGSK